MITLESYCKKVFLTERLKSKLSLIYSYPVTVVSAPLGYGKTLSVKGFLKENTDPGVDIYWSTAFNDDADGFFKDFCAAFSSGDPEFQKELNSLGMPQNHSDERTLIEIVKKYFPTEKTAIIVIDQMELSSDQRVQDFLLFFIRQMPNNIHLVIIGRSSSISSYDVYKFTGAVNYVLSEDFELDASDIEMFSRYYHINLPNGAASKLFSITGGWMCLVHMNLMEYRNNSGFYSPDEMVAIIEKIIISPMTDSQKRFINALSMCDEFSKDQALFLCSNDDAADIFETLYRSEAYIRLDRKTGKYHFISPIKLYSEKYANNCDETKKRELVNGLANWYLKIEENAKARQLFHTIGNYDALMDAVEKRKFLVTYGLDEQEFISYYTECPPSIRANHPKAVITFARQMFSIGCTELGYEACCEFEDIMRNHSESGTVESQQLIMSYELLLSYAKYNDLEKMSEHLVKIQEIEHTSPLPVWTESNFDESYSILFMYHRVSGKLSEEMGRFSEYAKLYSLINGSALCGADNVMRAEYAFSRNRVNEASIYLSKALFQIDRNTQWSIWLCAMLLDIRISVYSGDWSQIERKLAELSNAIDYRNKPHMISVHLLYQMYVNGILGIHTDLPEDASEFFTSKRIAGFRSASILYCIYSSSLLADNKPVPLLAMSDDYLESARKYPNLIAEIVLYIGIAAAYEQINDKRSAERHLSNALALAEPDGIIIFFVEYYRYISSILLRLKDSFISISTIVAQGTQYLERIGDFQESNYAQKVFGLTNRELEIARLASKRLSNKEIADKLNIAESTVKTQLSRAYSKLNIQKRCDLSTFFGEK